MPAAFIDRSDAELRLRAIVARIAKVDPGNIGIEDDLAVTLGIDSLSALRIAAAVETEFAITIPDERLHEVRSLGELAELVVADAALCGATTSAGTVDECPPKTPAT